MLTAIFKASYNSPRSNDLIGGICGTAFFVDEKTALTTNHLLNKSTFRPNDGFLYCKFWLLSEDGQVLIVEKDYLENFPGIDITKICFPFLADKNFSNFKTVVAQEQDKYILKGFLASVQGNPQPKITLAWNERGELVINVFNLDSVSFMQEGIIQEVRRISINSKDVIINNKRCLKLSGVGNFGLSGAPLIKADTSEVMGIMSFGFPENAVQKKELFAIAIEEVKQEIGI